MWVRQNWFCSENCALLSYYTASSGNFLQTFRDNLSVPSPGVKNLVLYLISWTLKIWLKCCPETSVRNCHYSLCNSSEESSSHPLRGGCLKSPIRDAGFGVNSWKLCKIYPILYPELLSDVKYHGHKTCFNAFKLQKFEFLSSRSQARGKWACLGL